MSDYHAVKNADIIIDGITVLAGENGCGKSTLSRWLYYLVNGVQQYEELTNKSYVDRVDSLIRRQNMAAREMRFFIQKEGSSLSRNVQGLSSLRRNFGSDNEINFVQQVQESFVESTHELADLLAEYLGKSKPGARRERILAYLHINPQDVLDLSAKQVAEDFVEKNMQMLNRMTEKLNHDVECRPFNRFIENIHNEFDEEDSAPQKMQLYEDNVELIEDDRVSSLFNMRRVIYIDTPMALANDSVGNIFWNELRRLIMQKKKETSLEGKKLLLRIRKILHGEAKMVETNTPFSEEELHFVSEDGSVNIEIEKAATGFKTFTYLQRLLENGYLGENGLLLVDEPEAHLHPQWIVEYARLLVLLHKELGQKIMLATHNPDMVAALRAIAERENVLGNTHFYIAHQSDEPGKYTYKDLGGEIGEIFSSFNIALSRIESYGTSSL